MTATNQRRAHVVLAGLALAIHLSPRALANDLALKRLVPAADSFELFAYRSGQALRVPDDVLSSKGSASMARTLRTGGRFHAKPPAVKGDFLVRLSAGKGTVYTVTLEYVSATGDLGSGTDWYTTPAAFRQKMAAVKAKLPRHWFTPPARRRPPAQDATPITYVDPRTIPDPKVLTAKYLTREQAIAAARQFCRAIGRPASGEVQAKYPAPPELEDYPDLYWKPRWAVTFGDGTEVEVVDGTGAISRYENMDGVDGDDTVRLTDAQALAIAKKALAAGGPHGEVLPPEVEKVIGGSQFGDVMVQSRRAFHGIPYKDQAIRITVYPRQGVVLFGAIFPTAPPPAVPTRINREQAGQVARREMQRRNAKGYYKGKLAGARLREVKRMVVESEPPGGLDPMRPRTRAGAPRIAWMCWFDMPDGGASEVFVDVENGHVLGGDTGLPC